MASRLELHSELVDILGNNNVYFNPPEGMKMNYDAIRYKRKKIDSTFASNSVYTQNLCYELVAIYRDPDSELPIKLSKLPKCTHDRQYVVGNLIHDVFTIYH